MLFTNADIQVIYYWVLNGSGLFWLWWVGVGAGGIYYLFQRKKFRRVYFNYFFKLWGGAIRTRQFWLQRVGEGVGGRWGSYWIFKGMVVIQGVGLGGGMVYCFLCNIRRRWMWAPLWQTYPHPNASHTLISQLAMEEAFIRIYRMLAVFYKHCPPTSLLPQPRTAINLQQLFLWRWGLLGGGSQSYLPFPVFGHPRTTLRIFHQARYFYFNPPKADVDLAAVIRTIIGRLSLLSSPLSDSQQIQTTYPAATHGFLIRKRFHTGVPFYVHQSPELVDRTLKDGQLVLVHMFSSKAQLRNCSEHWAPAIPNRDNRPSFLHDTGNVSPMVIGPYDGAPILQSAGLPTPTAVWQFGVWQNVRAVLWYAQCGNRIPIQNERGFLMYTDPLKYAQEHQWGVGAEDKFFLQEYGAVVTQTIEEVSETANIQLDGLGRLRLYERLSTITPLEVQNEMIAYMEEEKKPTIAEMTEWRKGFWGDDIK